MDILMRYVDVYENTEDELSDLWEAEEIDVVGNNGMDVTLRAVGLIGIDWRCEVFVNGEYVGRASESEFDDFLLEVE